MKFKNKTITYILIGILMAGATVLPSCTDLEEVPRDKVTSEVLLQDPELIPNLIAPALGELRFLWYREGVWGMQEACTDELSFPTRGTDWFDGGVWQEAALHTWSTTHRDVVQLWDRLNSGIASANFGVSVLGTEEDVDDLIWEYRGMLRFLRGFYMYYIMDFYGQVPYRDAFSTDYVSDPDYLTREEAFDFIVNDMKEIIQYMPDREVAAYGVPTKDAVYMLLAKLYLNKEVYTGSADWESAKQYLDFILESGNYGLADDYFGIFGPENFENYRQADDEAIFVAPLDDTDAYGMNTTVIWVQHTLHYNQTMGLGYANWNGCMALESYLEDCWFEGTDLATDIRWADSTLYADLKVVAGFNIGQQFGVDGDTIKTRGGEPLVYTVECPLDGAAENQGVRVLKYYPTQDPVNITRVPNDFVIWRLGDAMLMKAECLARTGDMSGALSIVNELRVKRGAPELANLELLDILDERGRELYWEGHRRQDMIRFGTFLLPNSHKDYTSPETALLMPIPQRAIEAADGLLEQNPGY